MSTHEHYTKINLREVEDSAPKFEMPAEMQARFARRPIGGETLGLSLFTLEPGFRIPFGHKHDDPGRGLRRRPRLRADQGRGRDRRAGAVGRDPLRQGHDAQHGGAAPTGASTSPSAPATTRARPRWHRAGGASRVGAAPGLKGGTRCTQRSGATAAGDAFTDALVQNEDDDPRAHHPDRRLPRPTTSSAAATAPTTISVFDDQAGADESVARRRGMGRREPRRPRRRAAGSDERRRWSSPSSRRAASAWRPRTRSRTGRPFARSRASWSSTCPARPCAAA